MKNYVRFSLFLAFTITALQGCYIHIDDDDFCESGSGRLTTETYDLRAFNRVDIRVPAEVSIVYSSEYYIVVETSDNSIHKIDVRVHSRKLVIDQESCLDEDHLKITIGMSELSGVSNFGTASVVSDHIWEADAFETLLSGSGDIDINLRSDALNSVITGSGSVRVTGQASTSKVVISGSGAYQGAALDTDRAKVVITGSGNASVEVHQRLTGTISGSGNIYYHGHPHDVDVLITGSGKIIKTN